MKLSYVKNSSKDEYMDHNDTIMNQSYIALLESLFLRKL